MAPSLLNNLLQGTHDPLNWQ